MLVDVRKDSEYIRLAALLESHGDDIEEVAHFGWLARHVDELGYARIFSMRTAQQSFVNDDYLPGQYKAEPRQRSNSRGIKAFFRRSERKARFESDSAFVDLAKHIFFISHTLNK